MMSKIETCLERIKQRSQQLSSLKREYGNLADKQSLILLDFINRAEEIAKATLLLSTLPVPLQILCRVLCEDFFLVCWISASSRAAEEYEQGVTTEVAKILSATLSNGWGNIQHTEFKEPVTHEFMKNEFYPKLNSLKTSKKSAEKIATTMGLQKVYDILYRTCSLHLHGNTFGLPSAPPDEEIFIPLSAIDSLFNCLLMTVALPRKAFNAENILTEMHLNKPNNS